jgi:GntR family transcriptional regulator, transcriptional repressor for pyruvate dehydrogenase complex
LPALALEIGLMNSVRARARTIADQLVDGIVSGKYPPGSRLPTELELCATTGVSRATLREAMKFLQQLGVTRIEQGRGSFVNPTESWLPFDPAVLAARVGQATADGGIPWAVQLAEARRVVEVDVAGLAASRRTERDLTVIGNALEGMRAASRARDVDAFATADLAFHQAVMDASGNEFVRALFDPVARLMHISRVESSEPAARRARALRAHRAIIDAITAGDSSAAVAAMREHLDETLAWTVRASRAAERSQRAVPASAGQA